MNPRKYMSILFAVIVISPVFLTCIYTTAAGTLPPISDKYDAGLRARIAKLKNDAALTPTDLDNVTDRVDILWDWANAYALTGGRIPVELPFMVSLFRSLPSRANRPGWYKMIDDYIAELRVRDEQPSAIGTLKLETPGPFTVDSFQTIKQTYTVGDMPLKPGGGFMVTQHVWNYLEGHVLNPDDPFLANYISISSSNPKVKFKRSTVKHYGMMHAAFKIGRPFLADAFILEKGVLIKGDTVTITYGDRSQGSPGFRIQSTASSKFILPLYVDLQGQGVFISLDWPGMQVVGGKALAVRGFAPSIVQSGEPFELSIRSEDFQYNQAGGTIPEYEVLLNGRPFTEIPGGPADERAITVLKDLIISAPGIYRFGIRSPDGNITGTSNPILVKDDPANRLFWGELHGHSELAEAQGSLDGYFRFGRDDARLDYISLSEHDLWMDDYEWQRLQNAVRDYKEEGRFIPILGYEWTVGRRQGGHHNVYFRDPDKERVPRQEAWRQEDLYKWLNTNDPDDVLVIPHAHRAGDWNLSDPNLERLVEIYSMHGTFEWYGNQYLKQGHEIGFVATSDDHRGHPGYSGTFPSGSLRQFGGLSAVIAPENTSDVIFSALRNRSVYATSGPRIILEADLNGKPIGTRQEFSAKRILRCRAIGTTPIDKIEIIKNGDVVHGQSFLAVPLKSRSWIQVGFESSSQAFTLDNPRGFRNWQGTLEVAGAKVLSVKTPGFRNRYVEKAIMDSKDPNRITFRTETRGRADIMLVELEGAGPKTSFEFKLKPSRESGISSGFVRPPAKIPAETVRLNLSAMKDGRLEHELKVSSSHPISVHVDRIKLQAVNPAGALEQKIEWTDSGPAGQNDYYYFRITQIDGNQAWSSPFWVGKKQ